MSKIFKILAWSILLLFVCKIAAADVTSVESAMCAGYKVFNGPLGKTFAIFAIVALGVGFFLGKVSWGMAIAVALGIGSIFGAPALVKAITGGTGGGCKADGTTDV